MSEELVISDTRLIPPAQSTSDGGTFTAHPARQARPVTEPLLVRCILTFIALAFLALFLLVPVGIVFTEAFKKGWDVYKASVVEPDALAAIKLTLLTAAIAVPLNTAFGLAAGWAIAKFNFKGKSILVTLIDLPFAVSPVISGLVFVLLFGRRGVLGPWLAEPKLESLYPEVYVVTLLLSLVLGWAVYPALAKRNLRPLVLLVPLTFLGVAYWARYNWIPGVKLDEIKVIFAVPGIVLATTFVTFPFVARELIAFMEAQGKEEEEAAVVLGASGWQAFRRVTLPNIKWGLLYGVILCNARAMGEFGAVSVVSGHIRGETNTIPLQVEILYNEYQFAAAFAVASLLTLLAFVTLFIKKGIEFKTHHQLKAGQSRTGA